MKNRQDLARDRVGMRRIGALLRHSEKVLPEAATRPQYEDTMSGKEKGDKSALQVLIAENCVALTPLVTYCYDLAALFNLSSL
jgi:hypothetical protein